MMMVSQTLAETRTSARMLHAMMGYLAYEKRGDYGDLSNRAKGKFAPSGDCKAEFALEVAN
jgi:hypothetical protein